MGSLLGALLTWFLGLFSGSTRNDEVALGKSQQQVADSKGDLAVIARANKAAQSVSEQKVSDDEMDLDRPL